MSAKRKHRRRVRMSVCLPATVDIIVGTDDDDPSEESDWEILAVNSTSCEAHVRDINEHAHDLDFQSMYVAAANAKDLP